MLECAEDESGSSGDDAELICLSRRRSARELRRWKLSELVAERERLLRVLQQNDVFVPDLPEEEDARQPKKLKVQRTGNGTGDTKRTKKKMKQSHRVLMISWIEHLEELLASSGVQGW